MHALPGGEVQGKLSGVGGLHFASPRAQAQQPGRQDLADLAQALLRTHAVGMDRAHSASKHLLLVGPRCRSAPLR